MLSISRGDSLSEFVAVHPVDTHGGAAAIRVTLAREMVIAGSVTAVGITVTGGTVELTFMGVARQWSNGERGLEQSMANDLEAEHRAAEGDGVKEWRTFDVLDDIGDAEELKVVADWLNEEWVGPFVDVVHAGVTLAGRRSVDGVEPFDTESP